MAWIAVVTNAGRALLDQFAAGGHTLNIEGATVGSGVVAEANLRIQTVLSDEEDTASVISAEAFSGGTKYKVQVGPASASVGAYTAHQIGIWAHLDSGETTLLMLTQDADVGVSVPLKSVSPNFAFGLYLTLAVNNTEGLTVNIDETAYVTVGTMSAALDGMVSGVKGNAESAYRHGDVNITPGNIGALPLNGETPMTGDLIMRKSSPYLVMQDANGISQVQWIGDTNQHKGVVVERHTEDNNFDFFYFPAPSATGAGAGYDILTTKNAVTVPQGGTGATTPAGACAKLASGIPTAAYTLVPNSNYGPNVSGGTEPLRCIKYGNGLKRLVGLISITGEGAANGGTLCTVPTGFEHVNNNNGGLQGWGTITRSSGGGSYLFRFSGNTASFWGAAVPTGTYAVNYLYF